MIPLQIHAMFGMKADFGGKPFSLVHYLAVKSAALINECMVDLYYGFEPSGLWWDRTKEYANLHFVPPPTEIAGVPLRHPAHQTDVLRLLILRDQGGIALDLDVICLRPFAPLLSEDVVLAFEDATSTDVLCNAVTLARAGADFLERWIAGYNPRTSLWQGFRSKGFDKFWGEMSTRYPAYLAKLFPDEVTTLPSSRFFPYDWRKEDVTALFGPTDRDSVDLPDETYCLHLWEMVAWNPYLRDLSLEKIREGESELHRILLPLIHDE